MLRTTTHSFNNMRPNKINIFISRDSKMDQDIYQQIYDRQTNDSRNVLMVTAGGAYGRSCTKNLVQALVNTNKSIKFCEMTALKS